MDKLERVTPESVGIKSCDIQSLIETLEGYNTQMHGIMIARYGKVCAEGWWAPFSPNLIHGLQSMTKTFLSTAVGALVTDGKLDINSKMTELVPEWMPEQISEGLSKLTVRHMLMMTSGCRKTFPACREDWLKGFFAQPIEDEPGTVFHYDGTNTSAIGAMVSKISRYHEIKDYLKERVLSKIGIDADRMKWVQHPDGYDYCGGGAFATLEDILRLGMLYEQKGRWKGEQIISEEWVDEATTKQTHNNERTGVPEYTDNRSSGYGYQIWMTKREGTYFFSGAHGQYVFVMPDKHLVIAVNQNIAEVLSKPNDKRVKKAVDTGDMEIDAFLELGEKISDSSIEENPEALKALCMKLESLSCPRKRSEKIPANANDYFGVKYHFSENEISLLPGVYSSAIKKFVLCTSAAGPVGVDWLSLDDFNGNDFLLKLGMKENTYETRVGVDGLYRIGHFKVPGHPELPDQVLATGYWEGEGHLVICIDYIETCYSGMIHIKKNGSETKVIFQEFSMFDEEGIFTEFDV